LFLSSKAKLSKGLMFFTLALLISGLLIGCTEQVPTPPPPTPPPSLAPAVYKPAIAAPPVSTTTPAPQATSPTPTPVFLPAATPTALPETEVTGPTATPGVTPAENQDQALAGNVPNTLPGLKLSDLPLFKGLPKIPLTNLPPPTETAGPARKANYGANGKPKIGIQAGHWMSDQLPDQLASLRGQTGGSGGGVREVDFTLDMARLVTKLLQDAGYEVDLLPATVPADYTADAFVAIHADASTSGAPSGYKLARSRFSPIPLTDDALLKALTASYGAATGLRLDDNITRNMTGYYAFNSRRRVYAVSKGTPAVIIETGYLTNAGDRTYLLAHKDTVANGIAQGVINFLNTRPPLGQREKPSQTTPGVMVSQDNTPVYDQPDGAPVAYLTKGQRFEVYEVRNDYYMVFLPYLNKAGFVRRADATNLTLPR
jgi:N-acetylmuramoyl-L-alanine amidase